MEILVCDKAVFRAPGWEIEKRAKPADWIDPETVLGREDYPDGWALGDTFGETLQQQRNRERAARRAAARVREIALCSSFKYFVTLTLDGSKVDRYDPAPVVRKLSQWLDNQVRRRGLAYLLVPEHHKDGAIHFHGFVNDAVKVVDSGTMTADRWKRPRRPRSKAQRAEWEAAGARTVYNLPEWSLGFTTAIELYGDYRAAVGYVCKYVGKEVQTGGKIGGRWYYHGGATAEPEQELTDIDPADAAAAAAAVFRVPEANATFWRICIRPDGTLVPPYKKGGSRSGSHSDGKRGELSS